MRKALKETYLSEAAEKELLNRLSRIEGHIRAVKGMIERGKCCDEIIIQVAAVKAATTQVAVELLRDHLKSCVVTCMEGGEEEVFDRLFKAVSVVLKQS
jgi:DNA-binding FrmR family transcriptional regulator